MHQLLLIISALHFHEQCSAVTAVQFSIFHGKTVSKGNVITERCEGQWSMSAPASSMNIHKVLFWSVTDPRGV